MTGPEHRWRKRLDARAERREVKFGLWRPSLAKPSDVNDWVRSGDDGKFEDWHRLD